MVARLFRLRVALFGGAFRGTFVHSLRVAFVLIACIAAAAIFAVAPTWFTEPGAVRTATDVSFGTIVLGLALLIPFFDSRENLSPRHFAGFPVRPSNIAVSMLITTVFTRPFLVLLAWLITLSLTRPEWQDAGWIAPSALVLVGLLAVVGVRFAAGLSQLVVGERFAGGIRTSGILLGVAMLPVLVFAVATTLRSTDNRLLIDTAAPMSWTPFGAPFAAIADVASGNIATGLARLAVVGGTVLVLALLWFAIVHSSLHRIERPVDATSARQGLGWFERFAARPAPVIAARALTYWMRDPRYKLALYAIPVAPIAILIAFLVAGADFRLAVALPLPILMLLLGWFLHNDVAMDSTAIWEHVASGIRGWMDRAGRLAPVLVFGIPIAVIGSSLTVTAMGEWRVLPALLGVNIGVLLVASGVSSVFSALMPYPATRPGDSPFVQPQWSGSGSGTAQTVSMLISIALSIAPVWASTVAIIEVSFAANVFALLFGIAFGLAVLFAGVAIGGRIFDRQGPEILAVTQIFD